LRSQKAQAAFAQTLRRIQKWLDKMMLKQIFKYAK
jgi:hypothetical protein